MFGCDICASSVTKLPKSACFLSSVNKCGSVCYVTHFTGGVHCLTFSWQQDWSKNCIHAWALLPYHPNSMYIHLGKGCTIWSYLEMHMLGKVLPFGLGYLSFCYLWKKLNELCLEIGKNIYLWWIWKTKHFIQEQLQLSLTLRWVEN